MYLLAFGMIQNLHSQVLVNETFSYTLNSALTSNGYTAHSGGTTNEIQVTSGALVHSGYPLSGMGNSISLANTGQDVNKGFAQVSSGNLFASMLVKATAVQNSGDYFFNFGASTLGTNYHGRLFIKKISTTTFTFGISKTGSETAAVYSTNTYIVDSTYLIVVEYQFNSGSNNDSIKLYINPNSSAPSNAIIASDMSATDLANVGTYVFRQGSSSKAPTVKISSLRISSTWADIFSASTATVATPTFNPTGGTYYNSQSVSLSSTTSNASIYYTLNGNNPTSSDALFSTPIIINSTQTAKARAYAAGMDSSAVATANYSFKVDTAKASVASGNYSSPQTVSLSSSTMSAIIYYTLNGNTPTQNDLLYSNSIVINSNITLKTRGYKTGYDSSVVSTYNYNFVNPSAALPTFSPLAGSFSSAQTVSISSTTSSSTIYYTLDGSIPTSASTLYATPLSVNTTTTIKARAYAAGMDSSAVAIGAFIIRVDTIHASVPSGTYTTPQTISLNTSTSGASIYYTLNGNTPTQSDSLYTVPFTISTNKTLKTIGFKAGIDSSVISTYNYIFTAPIVTLPLVDTFAYGMNSLLTDHGYVAAANAGINPIKVANSPLVYATYPQSNKGSSILIDTTGEDVKKNFYRINGGEVYASFLVNVTKATTSGDYFFHFGDTTGSSNFTRVFIKRNSSGALAFGISKTGSSTTYTSYNYALNNTYHLVINYKMIAGSSNDSVKLWVNPIMYSKPAATVVGNTNYSDLLNVSSYAFRQGSSSNAPRLQLSGLMVDTSWDSLFSSVMAPVATPTFNPAGGNFDHDTLVAISCATSGASIYYTTDGTNPSLASTLYSAPINVTGTTIIKAIGYKTGYDSSAVASAAYIFVVDSIIASMPTGYYQNPISVNLSTSTTGATIYYTIDGSTPTQSSPVYSSAINISSTIILKARGYKLGYGSSPVFSWAYSFGAMPGSLPFIDTFNIAINSTLVSYGYTAHSASGSNSIEVTGPALTYTNYPLSGSGNSITVDTTGEDVNKSFSSLNSGTVYSSFLLNVKKATTTGDYFFHMGADTLASTYKGRLFIKRNASNQVAFGISKSSTTASGITYTGFDYALNTTYHVIMAYDINSGTNDDSILLWIDPVMAIQPPALISCPDVTSTDLANVGSFAFRQGSGSNAPRVELSGLMIDTSWTNMFAGVPLHVNTPSFNPPAGTYSTAQNVSMQTTTPGSTIYYTLDGTTPNQSSTLYTGSVLISSTTTIKAIAYKTGYQNSSIGIANYSISAGSTPTVNTQSASLIGPDSAVLVGSVVSDGGSVLTDRGFCYATHSNPTISDFVSHVNGGVGAYNTTIKNLTPNTTYFFRAFATNSAGTSYGLILSFNTLNISIEPSISNPIVAYPNPTTEQVIIENAEGFQLNVLNANGALVRSIQLNSIRYTLNVSDLIGGVYILQMKKGNQLITLKLVVE